MKACSDLQFLSRYGYEFSMFSPTGRQTNRVKVHVLQLNKKKLVLCEIIFKETLANHLLFDSFYCVSGCFSIQALHRRRLLRNG